MTHSNDIRDQDASPDGGLSERIQRSGWMLLFCLLALVIAAVGFGYYRFEAKRIQRERINEIRTIARLKTDQILRWRQERIWDARRFAWSPPVINTVQLWLQTPDDADIREDLRQRLNLERETSIYCDALLADTNARVALSTRSALGELDKATARAVTNALAKPLPVLGELHRVGAGRVQLDVTAAVRSDASQPMAVVVLTVEAAEYLYPIIQSWPTSCRSGETLLVRREGDEVLFLNELRFQENSALILRQPLSQTNLPAVQAVLGRTGTFFGRDYRGVNVLAELCPIPGTTWHMVAKMDTAEIMAEVRYHAVMIFGIVAALILCVGGMTAYLYRTRQLAERRRVEEALARAAHEWQATFDTTSDAIWVLDRNHRIIRSNLAAEKFFARLRGDMIGRHCWEVVHGTTQPVPECPVLRARLSLHRETMELRSVERWLEITVDPIVETGDFAGAVHMVSDITERKRVELRIRHLNRVYAVLSEINKTLVRARDSQEIFTDACRIAVEKGGFHMAWAGLLEPPGIRVRVAAQAGAAGEDLEKLNILLAGDPGNEGLTGRALQSGKHAVCNDIEHDTGMAPWREHVLRMGCRASAAFPLTAGGQTVGVFNLYAEEAEFFDVEELRLLDELAIDISFAVEVTRRERERQRVEKALHEREEQLARLVETVPDGITLLDHTGRIVSANPAAERILGLSRDDIKGRTYHDPKWRITTADGGVFPEEQLPFVQVMRTARPVYDVEHAIEHPNGRRVILSVNAAPVFGAAGEPTGMVAAITDITERKRVEKALREQESKMSSVFRASPIGMGLTRNRVLIEVNDRVCEMTGYTREELVGQSARLLYLTNEEYEHVDRIECSRIEETGIGTVEARWRRKDGRILDVLLGSSPLEPGDPNRGVSFTVMDITERVRAEKALRDGETRYRHMLRSVTDYIYRVEFEQGQARSTTHGPGCQTVTGYTPEEYAANPHLWFEMIHMEDREPVQRHTRRILQGEFSEPLEHRIIHKDGSVRWVRNTLVPRRDAAGQLIACDGMIADITERKKAERALARGEAELSAIYEHAPVIMCLLSGDGRVRRLNRAALEFVGGTNDDATGKAPGDFMGCVEALSVAEGCGHDPGCGKCPLRLALLDTARTGATHHRVESTLHLLRNGQAREMMVLASTARVDVEGEPRILLCLQDITSQKEAEARIRQQAALLDQTQDAVLVVGLDRLVRYCNRSAEEFFGRPAEQLLGQNVEVLVFPGAPAQCAEACLASLEKGAWSGEACPATSMGISRVVFSRWTLIRDAASRPSSFLIVNTDVTEQKRLEEQLLRAQRMESIGTLASGIAHDLNNILAPILIATEVLRPMAKGPDEEEVVDMLRKGAERGADIIRQLLMFGRGEEGERVDLQPRDVLKEILKVIKETFPKTLVLEHNLPENLWTIHADPTQVHQVLLNLCVNARDAMPQGGILSISAENLLMDEQYAAMNREAKPGPYVVMEVGDTGIGIPPEIMHKIFDPFFTTKEPGKGTGLGLSTVLGIVKSHGGFTQVASRPGEGTRFKIYFPALEAQHDLRAAKSTQRPPGGHGELILVVDDEECIRTVAERVLVKLGYRVLTASEGADGLVTFSRHQREIKAAVVDMVMPVMDGASLIRSLRHRSPGLRIIAMSGLAVQKEEAEKAGVTNGAFLVKPFEPEALLNLLHKVLAEHGSG
jgi:PAS domain S-box-containing protein